MPILTNLKYNPNKVYAANVNNLRELQIIKQNEENYQAYLRYSQGYQVAKNSYYAFPVQNPPMCSDPAGMAYYQPQYPMMTNQYYSPPVNCVPYYAQPMPMPCPVMKKPSTKLSTKSPHAITGHKLTRSNTVFTPKGVNRNLVGVNNAQTPPPGYQQENGTFSSQAALNNQFGRFTLDEEEPDTYNYNCEPVSSNFDMEPSLFRKSTFDETENYRFQKSVSPFSSPEERNLQLRLISSFQLNTLAIESEEEEDDEENHKQLHSNTTPQPRMNKLYAQIKNEEENIFNVFEPYHGTDETFQNVAPRSGGSSSGPIFSLISSQAESPGTSN